MQMAIRAWFQICAAVCQTESRGQRTENSLRHRQLVEQLLDHVFTGHAFGFGFVAEEDAVTQDVWGEIRLIASERSAGKVLKVRGEAVVVKEQLGVRIIDVVSPERRLKNLQ